MLIPFDQRDDELDEEIRAHLDMDAAERVRRGEPPADAHAAARRDFGNLAHVTELSREASTAVWFERLIQDLRYAARSLARSPSFTLVAVLTFALGIGATTAIFTVVRGILLRPLPFRDPARLFAVGHMVYGPASSDPAMYDYDFVRFRQDTRSFAIMAMYHTYPMSFVGAGEPDRFAGARVTPGFLAVLGVRPVAGRDFAESDDMAPVLMISHAIWRDRFGGDTAAIGRSIEVDGERRTIIGILPPGFDFPSHTHVWLPMTVRENDARWMGSVVGRLKPGVTRDQARAELAGWVTHAPAGLRSAYVGTMTTTVTPLRDALVGDVRRPLLIFMAAVTFVLLIACANVTSLLLMRGTSREHELSIRSVLGASRGRLIRQSLTESLLLAGAGGVAGVGVAWGGVRLLLAMMPDGLLPRADEIRFDFPMLAAMAIACLVTGVLFGLVPALVESRRDARLVRTSGARVTRRLRTASALVVFETALALTLLVGAGLVARSFVQLRAVKLGFRADNLLAVTVDLPEVRYQTIAQLHAFAGDVSDRLAHLPGVIAAAAVNSRPLDPSYIMGDFALADGRELPTNYAALKPCVTPDYCRVMGIAVRQGRVFTAGDDASAERVVVVSRSLAARFWPAGDAVGQRISLSGNTRPEDWLTIVGVVDDVVHQDLAKQPTPAIYQAIAQMGNRAFINHLTFVAKTGINPETVSAEVRQALHAADSDLPVGTVTTMQGIIASSIAEPRFQMRIFAIFSATALLLAVVGIYGVLAYFVVERRHEIGIRMALGASPAAVRRMVVGRSLTTTAIGVGIGVAGSLALTRLLGRFLFEIAPGDPVTFAGVTLLLVVVAVVTSWVPAVRASKTDPLLVIRRA